MSEYFYVARQKKTGLIKIGISAKPEKRMEGLSSELPGLTLLYYKKFQDRDGRLFEAIVKKVYRKHAIKGKTETFAFPKNFDVFKFDKVPEIINEFKRRRFERKFSSKYFHKGGIEEFKSIVFSGRSGSLTRAGKHFGITKERARQIKEMLLLNSSYGCPCCGKKIK